MTDTFPTDRTLGAPERIRLFKKDRALVAEAARRLGVEADEAKRRAVHVGLREMARRIGIEFSQNGDGRAGKACADKKQN